MHAAVAGVCAGRGRRSRRSPAAAAARLAGIPVGELRGYGAREQARTGHLQAIAQYLGTPVTEPRQTSVRS